MGRGRDATTYGFCKENRDDIVECGREMAMQVTLSDHYRRRSIKKIFRLRKARLQGLDDASLVRLNRVCREKREGATFYMTNKFTEFPYLAIDNDFLEFLHPGLLN
jgi:hypothetical protein